MENHKKAALEMNALATEMNSFGDSHTDLIGRLIGLTDEVNTGPTADTLAAKAELVVDFQSEGLNDWADQLRKIQW
ncbi:hypothetical protein [Pelagibacterium sp.]|uniref:hypothetical protein n=1 Tax=Pelagibacterium sp. TaxID=1967288 RepID=UPI003A8F90A7